MIHEEIVKLEQLLNENLAKWLQLYVDSPEFMANYTIERSIKLISEATFWSVKLGLEPYLATRSYAEIRDFKPVLESISKLTEYGKLLAVVVDH
ncbi:MULTISPECIES: hypothetical protein [Legionella]|uniref:hypothetical protein n=1 Tax=Legionella TaxID=445 RepID=UPI000F8E8907|nr:MULTISPECIES: hypothetical protein [Legionella]MCP0913691.1 hypothetical protein [Legionella sp. 27cVA30]RUQ97496.1 hypothetical protein ELY11_06500 [Legionella septentrionalis]RUR09792.1 hypothetical protein ELY14_07650 [Legionella septentrionalis]RUR15916.1 hypothetical protein ELY10_04515 [Legionella septentrionalis]